MSVAASPLSVYAPLLCGATADMMMVMNPMMMANTMVCASVCVLLDGAHHVRKRLCDCLPTTTAHCMRSLNAALLLELRAPAPGRR